MLELYHHGSSVCAAKVRIVLEEKSLEFEKHYVDILAGEQFRPEFVKLNPKAVVPVLVHDGAAVTESTVICDYLHWISPETKSLIPADPLKHAAMRYWTKFVDEELHWACGTLTFMSSHRYTVNRMGPEKVEEFLNNTPQMSLSSDWKVRKRRYVMDGLNDPDARKALVVHEIGFDKMQKALEHGEYLAGDEFSLADAAMIPYVNRVYMLSMLEDWCSNKPKVLDWFDRMRARPTWGPAVEAYLPEHLANDLRNNGAKSWPQAKGILEAALAG